jgi:membrane associated rhomboid family serine protease
MTNEAAQNHSVVHKWLFAGWPPDLSGSYWTVALAIMTVGTCVVQALTGWKRVISAIGFVPAAAWDPSSWLTILPGQSLCVVLTWFTYPFPHMNWWHMASNVVGLLLFGSVVERMLGTLRYAIVTVFAAVLGVFGLAAVHPLGTDAIGGGSLLLCTVLGVWLAAYSQGWWRAHRFWTGALEVAAIAALAAWLGYRTPPPSPSALMGLLWHLPSLMIGWFGFRLLSATRVAAPGAMRVGNRNSGSRPG